MFETTIEDIKHSSTGEKVYLFGLFLMSVGMPTSKFLMSISFIFIGLGWLLERDRIQRLKSFFSLNAATLISSIFLIHLVSLLWSENLIYAWKDIRIKLPLLFFPFLVYTMPKLGKERWSLLINCFILSTLVTSVLSLGNLFLMKLSDDVVTDTRDAFLFISHIRLSLMISLSTIWIIFRGKELNWKLIFRVAIISFFLFFLFYMQVLTGVIAFIVTFLLISLIFSKRVSKKLFIPSVLIVAVGIVYIGFVAVNEYHNNFSAKEHSCNSQIEYSRDGNLLNHDPNRRFLENGFLTNINYQDSELMEAWNNRSDKSYLGKGASGNTIKYTLIRFITSKGWIKDGQSVRDLSEEEILAIESGIPNVEYLDMNPLEIRINRIFFELQNSMNGGVANGHSLTQRFEFIQTGWEIWKKNKLFGTGIGDLNDAFVEEYKIQQSKLKERYRLRAHNQLLTFMVSLGMIGFIWILSTWIYPIINLQSGKSLYYISFFIIFLLSCLNEDTLETQAGLSFYCFFTSLLLFGKKE